MKKFALAASLLLVSAVGASAADLPARTYSKAPAMVEPVSAYNWTGFYVGVNGGGGWQRTNWFFNVVGTTANQTGSGGLAGGQIGYNWQTGPWVFGLEADGDWANIKGSTLCPNPAFTCSSNVRDLASFRGRVGWATGPVLLYGTGGLGYANSNYSALTPGGGIPPAATGFYSASRWGYAAGAGVEWGFMPNWSAKLEYMHYGFGTSTAPAATLGANTAALGLDVDTVKVGVNWHFGGPGPVVARY